MEKEDHADIILIFTLLHFYNSYPYKILYSMFQ
jgi:hypothetical protein